MYGSAEIIGRVDDPTNERCVHITAASEAGGTYFTILPSITALRENVHKQDVNVRIGDQDVLIRTTGCANDVHHSKTTVAVVVECPNDEAERCEGCVLNTPQGETIRNEMRTKPPESITVY